MSTSRKRVAVLISGRGSNMTALIEAAGRPDYPAEISLVISNQLQAGGLETAAAAGIATRVVSHRDFADRAGFDAALQRELDAHAIDIVCLAGFMRILTDAFVERWRGRMLNVHPSLLPAFKGLHPHAQALAAGATSHGCTVHFVVPELDSGPIVLQRSVPVLRSDTEATLAARVLAEEHHLYPLGLAAVARGEARIDGGAGAALEGAVPRP